MPRQMPVPPPVTSATWPASTSSRNTSRGLGIRGSCTRAKKSETARAPLSHCCEPRRCCSRSNRAALRGSRPASPEVCMSASAMGALGDVRPRDLDLSCLPRSPTAKTVARRLHVVRAERQGRRRGRAHHPQQLHDPGRLLDLSGGSCVRRDSKKRRAATPSATKFALRRRHGTSAEASAAVCGDDGWAIEVVKWSCEPNKD